MDALLAAGALRDAIVGVTTDRLECGLADAVSETLTPAFKGFGSSDCGCATHLFSAASAGRGEGGVVEGDRQLGVATMSCRVTGSESAEKVMERL